jgi:drug/metabolite transporter (DMT)-like permease
MKKSSMVHGFLLLVTIDTFVQIAFKFAGENTLPVSFDLAWLSRVAHEPWLAGALVGAGAAFATYMTLIRHAPIGPAFAASHLDIVAVTLFSVLYLGASLTPWQMLGCCAIVTGVLVLAVTEPGS